MNLRELLVSAMDSAACTHEDWDCLSCQADAALDRLTRPDVLAEFERRVHGIHGLAFTEATRVRRVLAHMLTETKVPTAPT